jgi:hypothetical protein
MWYLKEVFLVRMPLKLLQEMSVVFKNGFLCLTDAVTLAGILSL